MEQFHAISIVGGDARHDDRPASFETSRRQLNRETAALHARHATLWLLRGIAIAGLYLVGRHAVDGAAGSLLAGAAAPLGAWLLWYVCKGHLTIHKDHRAKFYWLKNDAVNREFSSDDPLVATMPSQEMMAQNGRAAS